MNEVPDAIRKVTATMQRRYDDGEVSAMIDLHDLIEVLLSIADEIDPPLVGQEAPDTRGCEYCRAEFNRPDGQFTCPYCHAVWDAGDGKED